MLLWRSIWALTLSALLAFTFRRAWKWEHGAAPRLLLESKYGKLTYVFIPPTYLFALLLALALWLPLVQGFRTGLGHFMAISAEMLITLCFYDLLMLALLPLLRRWVSARACAVLWLVPVFLYYQAHGLFAIMDLPRWTVYVPKKTLLVLCAVWLAGFLAVGGYYLLSHMRFRRRVRRMSRTEWDADVRAIWNEEREAMDFRFPTELKRAAVAAPFSMGRTNRSRCTVLPERTYAPEELRFVFRHELHHLQRCDVDTKAFFCLCNAFCWFNPLMWIATRKAAQDLERSCDEIVTEGMDAEERKAYARLLLDAAGPVGGCTTCLSAAAGTLRYRLKSVVDQRRRILGTALLAAALFVTVLVHGSLGLTDARGSFTELLLPEGTEISGVIRIDGGKYQSTGWDEAALRQALDGIELEHVAGLRNAPGPERGVALTLHSEKFRYVDLSDGMVTVIGFPTKEYYIVRGGADFGAICAALRELS